MDCEHRFMITELEPHQNHSKVPC